MGTCLFGRRSCPLATPQRLSYTIRLIKEYVATPFLFSVSLDGFQTLDWKDFSLVCLDDQDMSCGIVYIYISRISADMCIDFLPLNRMLKYW